MTILGPNGVGKTTLLKCIMGFLRWNRGGTLISGKRLTEYSDKELWSKISYVPQAKQSVFSYGVLEMVVMGLDKENGFSWLGHYDISVDDLLSGIPKEKKSEQAENLILEYLSKGKYPQQALLKKAQAVGISKRVLDEAKKALNVQSVKEGSQWYWQLPEKTE